MAKLNRRTFEAEPELDPSTPDAEDEQNGAAAPPDDPVMSAIEQMKDEGDLLKLKAWIDQVQSSLDELRGTFEEKAAALVAALGLSVPPAAKAAAARVVVRTAPKTREPKGIGSGGVAETAARIVAHMRRNKMKDATRSKLALPLDLSAAQASAALKYAIEADMLTRQGERGSARYNLP